MSSALAVYLTNEAPAAHWNPKSNVVFDGDAAKIILVDDESENLRRIQKAGRTLDNNGVIKVAVSGDGWDMERQWALYQGFTSTLSKNDVIWHADDAEAAKHLDAMRDATRFSRELTNLPAEDI